MFSLTEGNRYVHEGASHHAVKKLKYFMKIPVLVFQPNKRFCYISNYDLPIYFLTFLWWRRIWLLTSQPPSNLSFLHQTSKREDEMSNLVVIQQKVSRRTFIVNKNGSCEWRCNFEHLTSGHFWWLPAPVIRNIDWKRWNIAKNVKFSRNSTKANFFIPNLQCRSPT